MTVIKCSSATQFHKSMERLNVVMIENYCPLSFISSSWRQNLDKSPVQTHCRVRFWSRRSLMFQGTWSPYWFLWLCWYQTFTEAEEGYNLEPNVFFLFLEVALILNTYWSRRRISSRTTRPPSRFICFCWYQTFTEVEDYRFESHVIHS